MRGLIEAGRGPVRFMLQAVFQAAFRAHAFILGVRLGDDRAPRRDGRSRRRRHFDAVLVWRFGRTVKHMVVSLEEFRDLGIEFISLSESIDTTTPYGKLLYVVVAGFAEFVADITRENVNAGLERARREGKTLGCPKSIFDRRRIRELRETGFKSLQIAEELGVSQRTVLRLLRKEVWCVSMRFMRLRPPA